MQGGIDRRSVLRAGGTAFAVLLLAGCGSDGGSGTTTTSGHPSTTTADPGTQPQSNIATTAVEASWSGPDYARWLPAPGTLLRDEPYRFTMAALSAYDEHRGSLPPGLQGVVENWQPIELDWRSVELAVLVDGNNVIEAPFDPDDIAATVTDTTGWTAAGTYGGYQLYRNADDTKAFAVGDVLVVARRYGESQPATATAEGFIDTAAGEVAPYPGTDDVLDAVIDEFDGGFTNQWIPVVAFPETQPSEPEFEDQAGIGRWGRWHDDGTTAVKLLIAFRDVDALDLEAVRGYVAEHSDAGEQFGPWTDTTVRGHGPVAVIEGTIPASD